MEPSGLNDDLGLSVVQERRVGLGPGPAGTGCGVVDRENVVDALDDQAVAGAQRLVRWLESREFPFAARLWSRIVQPIDADVDTTGVGHRQPGDLGYAFAGTREGHWTSGH